MIEPIEEQLMANANELMENSECQSFLLTGYGTGAALATLAASLFKAHFSISNYTLFTFGSPRVGNLAYKQWL